jgi:TPR repeat protein
MPYRDSLALASTAPGEVDSDADAFFNLGLVCAAGGSEPADMISAHKWFNLAATHGHMDAARLRREIAAEMSSRQIADALRAARDWRTHH